MIIDDVYIKTLLKNGAEASAEARRAALSRAEGGAPLTLTDAAALLHMTDAEDEARLFALAGKIKNAVYGNRVVLFAPLYVSDYCVNNCAYCGYKKSNGFRRRKLTFDEIRQEVELLESLGHKRLALEFGEDYENCPMEYILGAIGAVYDTKNGGGEIRRVNVNIAATTVENYAKLKEKGIGTYILFQETYHKATYERLHRGGPKSDYGYHLTAFDRAMQGGVDDVGAGVLFGLYDYKYEVMALLLHNAHLERTYGAGFHTISVPRLRQARGNDLRAFPHLVGDSDFKRIIALLRIAVPYTGIILSTRESAALRNEAIHYGVSQISAGSATGVGAYRVEAAGEDANQFEIADRRAVHTVVADLMNSGFIPSYCTACYRKGRTGDRFFALARSGEIKNVCAPNAIMTLAEYVTDYGDDALKSAGLDCVKRNIAAIEDESMRTALEAQTEKILAGKRDLYF
ncbi:MAG: [FeFe] hydrogenase H-cluster radical SAM maturase HydG [Clostridiales bacterium]|jgi:2-iminoacetate synthase|nr:[FeFe] hydrogenase H-cluster radical SAM maturase HydG [Clostridiales bacterium]